MTRVLSMECFAVSTAHGASSQPAFVRELDNCAVRLADLENCKSGQTVEEVAGPVAAKYTRLQCFLVAMLYAFAGMGITFVNNFTLAVYKFPSATFLGFTQLLATTILIGTLKRLNVVQFEDVSRAACRKIMPMPLFFLGNLVFGLGATKLVSIPTLTAMRKFSILFTMILERVVLGRSSSWGIQFSVLLMIGGAFVASCHDLNFNGLGYLYVMANNVLTAGQFVVTKQKAEMESFGAVGSLFYCALVALPISMLLMVPDLHLVLAFPAWSSLSFVAGFMLSTLMACVVTFSTILCTKVNSGLTTSVVGCIRNIVPVYVGMLSVFGYSFNAFNFAGHTLSVFGALVYSGLKLRG